MQAHDGHWQCLAKEYSDELYGACKVAELVIGKKQERSDAEEIVLNVLRNVIEKIEQPAENISADCY